MFKIDGSQTTWLVYADWLEDQGIPANHIRELATEINRFESVNFWCCGWRGSAIRVGGIYQNINGEPLHDYGYVGSLRCDFVGEVGTEATRHFHDVGISSNPKSFLNSVGCKLYITQVTENLWGGVGGS